MSIRPRALTAALALVAAGSLAGVGEDEHRKIVESGQVYDDVELQEYINRIGQRLAGNSNKPKQKFTFTVLDTEMINAFAAPGGYVYVSRGLLPYLESESELAGVLGHEVAHVTASHHSRRRTADITNKVLATTAYIFTGSRDLADASTMFGTEVISGFGRDMELEADGYGAEFMHKSGYDPDSLLDVIGVLKDQEQYARVRAKASGKPAGTYHGLYATHPRNDKRLQTVIRKAGELDLKEDVENPEVPGEFRRQIQGLTWGPSPARKDNRFYHNKLGFTFEHPQEWSVNANSKAIVAAAPDNKASLTITVKRKGADDTPKKVLEGNASGELSVGKELEQAGLAGYSAVASDGSEARRLAVIEYRGLNYLFLGQADSFAARDSELLAMIESFRPMHPQERATGPVRTIHYIQVPRGATMASLAASIRIPDAENQLRLLNGFYPRGEPRTGDWIKIIK